MESGEKSQAKEKVNSRRASRSTAGVILRIVLTLVVGIVVGGAIYFSAVGWIPYLDQRIFQPLEDNQDLTEQLNSTQQALAKKVEELSSILDAMQSTGQSDIQSTLAAMLEEIDRLDQSEQSLTSEVDTNTYYIATYIPSILATADAERESTALNLSAQATAQMGNAIKQSDVELLRIMALLSRANQYLLHANYGLAEDELVAARDYMIELGKDGDELIQDLLDLVNEAIQDLPFEPDLAEGKLELAWHLILDGFQKPYVEEYSTPTPSTTPQEPAVTPTPTPN